MPNPPSDHDWLDAKTIAVVLSRHVGYVYAMKRRGFTMIGGRATMAQVVAFLARVPMPRSGEKSKGRKRADTHGSAR